MDIENTIYAIKVSYDDGYTYSVEELNFFSTNKQELELLCKDFTSKNTDLDINFSVVEINLTKTISESSILELKKRWGMSE